MGKRHSQNRQASPHYSHAERNALPYGTKKARVGSESFRRFDTCCLCLMPAREPRTCEEGHVFCHECILTSLLEQKRDLKRQQKLVEQMRIDEAAERAETLERARARVLADFERAQSSSSRGSGVSATGVQLGTKRKIEAVDGAETEVGRMMRDSESAALDKMAAEQAEARKSKLPNFWLPSETPDAGPARLEDVKLTLLCKASKPTHPISLKALVECKFTPAKANDADAGSICAACRRSLTNSADVHVMSPCGDALCSMCTTTLAKPDPGHCPTCDTAVKRYIALKTDGTGYASRGGVELTKKDVVLR